MRVDNTNVLLKGNNMKALWETVGAGIRHNVPLIVAVIACVFMLTWGYGCESKVVSISDPGKKVTRAELKLEVNEEAAILEQKLVALAAKAKVKNEKLDKEDAMKASLLEIGMAWASGGAINPVGTAFTIFGILGIGAVANSREKDKVIAGNNMVKKEVLNAMT